MFTASFITISKSLLANANCPNFDTAACCCSRMRSSFSIFFHPVVSRITAIMYSLRSKTMNLALTSTGCVEPSLCLPIASVIIYPLFLISSVCLFHEKSYRRDKKKRVYDYRSDWEAQGRFYASSRGQCEIHSFRPQRIHYSGYP